MTNIVGSANTENKEVCFGQFQRITLYIGNWDDKHSQSLIRDAKLLSGNHEDVFAIEPSQLWWQHQQDFDYSLKFYTFFYFPFLFISHDWRISDDVSGTLATSSFTTKNLATAFNIKHIRGLLVGG